MKDVLFKLLTILLLVTCLLTGCRNGNSPQDTSSESSNVPESGIETEKPKPTFPVTKTVTLNEDTLKDKIAGSWVAQMVGVTWGAPTEFIYPGKIMPDNAVPKWTPSTVNDAFGQDDLYVEVPFIDAMKDHGVECSIDVIGNYFRDSKFGLAHANLIGRENLQKGIAASEAGHYKNSYHADDIDWQIEADFLGNFYPGLVNQAAARSFELGHLMNYGDGVYGGVYVAAMHAAAFTTNSLREVLNAGLQSIPEGTKFRDILNDVEKSYANGDTWETCWKILQDKWGNTDKCSEFHASSANIDAKMNAAYIHIGLLWGEGDFEQTMRISMRCGQDSDCNPSSSAAVLGTLYGFNALPTAFTEATDFTHLKFAYTDYTLNDCINLSYDLAIQSLQLQGATKVDQTWSIPTTDQIYPVTFEQWPDDEITLYLNITERANGKIGLSVHQVIPFELEEEEMSVKLDMGDGFVSDSILSTYQYLEPGTYTVKYSLTIGSKSATIEKNVHCDFNVGGRGFQITPSCSVSSPQGGGNKDIQIITDGVIPSYPDILEQYDTYTGQSQTQAWYALNFDHQVTVTDVVFSEGNHFENGGWFKKTPSIELLIQGEWVKASTTNSPLYIEVDGQSAQGDPFETFTFTLATPTECEGVRIIGTPGGSSTFVSCSELDIKYSNVKNPTYNSLEQDCIKTAVPIVSETNPTGAGNKDLSIMYDGQLPGPNAHHSTDQYDTYTNRSDDHEEYYGYLFRGTWTVSSVSYTCGATFGNGGWFKNGTLRVQALIDGEWEDIDAEFQYPNADSQGYFKPYQTYVMEFYESVDCNGIRIIGDAGGSAHFTSVSELSFEAAPIQ